MRRSKKTPISVLADVLAFIAVILLLKFLFGSLCEGFQQKKIVEKYIEDEPKIQELYNIIKPLFDDPNQKFSGKLAPLNKMNFLKKISMKKGNKSYTINKEFIHMCLRDENGNYYPNTTLVPVLLHEFAHVINNTIGHDKSFQDTLDELNAYAESKGIYDPTIPIVPNYCEYSTETD